MTDTILDSGSLQAPRLASAGYNETKRNDQAEGKSRVRLGSAVDTAADVLLDLAHDPDVTVRAAVAMNPACPAQANHLLARDADERVRTLLARKLSALIPTLPGADRDRLRDQALATLTCLVEDEAVRVRNAIADVLKAMPQAPRHLILRLAHDRACEVSDPVIQLSPLLTSEDLLALLQTPPTVTAATAVARRALLSEAVSDAVAATADVGAITALLQNPSAAIREGTLDGLIAQAVNFEAWHAPLVRRPRLSQRATQALSEIVATHLLSELASRSELPETLAADLRRRLSDRLQPEPRIVRTELDLETAVVEAQRLLRADKLTEEALLAAVQQGESRMAIAMLAVAAEVPATVVDRAASLRSAKGLVSLIWKAGFTMRVAGPVQTLLARLAPNAVLRPTGLDGFPLALEEMRWQLDFLARVGR